MAETWSFFLLDCGASKIVYGQEWLIRYITNLSEHKEENIKFKPSNNVYRYDDGRKIKVIQNVTFPPIISKKHKLSISHHR